MYRFLILVLKIRQYYDDFHSSVERLAANIYHRQEASSLFKIIKFCRTSDYHCRLSTFFCHSSCRTSVFFEILWTLVNRYKYEFSDAFVSFWTYRNIFFLQILFIEIYINLQALVFMCLQYKSFENIVGKGEIAHN